MSYEFNPLDYDMLTCVKCGADIPLAAWNVEQARVQLSAGAREVPGLYVCKACESHVSHVEPVAAFLWLTGFVIPQGMAFAMSVAKDDDASLMTAVSGLAIALDVEAGNELAGVLARELAGIPADPEPEPQDVPDPMPADEQGASIAEMLDMRREQDGTVSYECPNPVCPVGRHNFMEMADKLPINVVAALIGALPE